MIWPLGAIICGALIMALVAFAAICAILVNAIDGGRTSDRLDAQAPQSRPWTVRAVSTPMLADEGIPELYHVYDPAGHHACNRDDDFCYLTRAEAEAAAQLGEQFTSVVTDAVGGAR